MRFDLSDGPTRVFGNQRFRITGGFLQMGQGGGNTGVAEGDADTRGSESSGPLPPSIRADAVAAFSKPVIRPVQ